MRRDDHPPTADDRSPGADDRLNDFLDAVVSGQVSTPLGIDPWIAATAHQVHALPDPPPDSTLKRRVWDDLLAIHANPAPIATPPAPTVPNSRNRPRPTAVVPPRGLTTVVPLPADRRRDTGSFATAAFMLIIVAAISAGALVLGHRSGDAPPSLPAGIAATAQPAPMLYIGHAARLTAEIPGDWTVDPISTVDYSGSGGFIASEPVTGNTLDEACTTLAASQRFDAPAAVSAVTWNGGDACHVTGQSHGTGAIALVVSHPYPFDLWADRYAFAALITEPNNLDAIAATLDFSPERVTPEAYALSLLDLVEARSYWSDILDWPTVRRQVFDFVEGLETVEMARQGVLNIITAHLRLAGDNSSSVELASQLYTRDEAYGFGALIGGQQILLVYSGSPADRAGILPDDIIETVGGRAFAPSLGLVENPTSTTAAPMPSDTRPVELTLRRPGVPEPIAVTLVYGPYTRDAPPTGRQFAGSIGYLSMPGFYKSGQVTASADTARETIAAIDAMPTCGWIVDLRLNGGGPVDTTLSALSPLFDNGIVGGRQDRDGRQFWVTSLDGRIASDLPADAAADANAFRRPSPPVAVLIGPPTASGGEAAALAFVGRPDARLFGEPTAGLTTVSQTINLFDGSVLSLATLAMTDRTGATHPTGIQPDELVATDWTTYGTDADPVLTAAQAWLSHQPGCAAASSTPSS